MIAIYMCVCVFEERKLFRGIKYAFHFVNGANDCVGNIRLNNETDFFLVQRLNFPGNKKVLLFEVRFEVFY